MAASLKLTPEKVISKIFSDDSNSDDESESSVDEKEDSPEEKIKKYFNDFEMRNAEIKDRFVDSAVKLLVPLYEFSITHSSSTNACKFLDSMPLHAGSLFLDEGKIWLNAIFRRFSGRRSTRTPFFAEIHRCIPYSIFSVLVRLISNSSGFAPPFAVISRNRKAEVISITSIRLLKELFSILSGLTESKVVTYFKRDLTGMRKGHKVNLIVDDTKEFSFMYKFSKGELTISYHFGEWNTCGVALHY